MADNLVEQLKYLGGHDEGLGGYCEALVIKIDGGKEKYILHRYGEYLETVERSESPWAVLTPEKKIVCGKHEKTEFETKKELLKAFPGISLTEWQETDRCCGYKIPRKEFQKAHERRFEEEFKNR